MRNRLSPEGQALLVVFLVVVLIGLVAYFGSRGFYEKQAECESKPGYAYVKKAGGGNVCAKVQ